MTANKRTIRGEEPLDEPVEPQPQMNAPAPRVTKLWRGQVHLLGEALKQALADPTIRAYWGRTAELFAGMCGLRVEFSDPRTEQLVMLIRGTTRDAWRSLEALTKLCRERAPALDHALGPYLSQWLLAFIHGELGVELPKEFLPRRIYRLLPDNPVVLRPDGSAVGFERAKSEHFHEVRDYYRSLRPEGRRGRPQDPGRPKSGGRQQLDPELARRAAHLKDAEGKDWTEVARILMKESLLPAFDLYEPRQRQRARQRIRRLIVRVRELSS